MKDILIMFGAFLVTTIIFSVPVFFGVSIVLNWYPIIKVLLGGLSIIEIIALWLELIEKAEEDE